MSNPAESISRGDEIQSLGKRLLKCFACASLLSAHKGFHFGERLFNGREIGRIGGQEQETTSPGFNGLPHPRPVMDREIIQDHDLPWTQAGSKELHHEDFKSRAISSPIQQKRRSHAGQRQRSDHGHDGSVIAGNLAVSSLPSWGVGIQRGHSNVRTGLIHKHQVIGSQLSRLLAPGDPFGFLLLTGSSSVFFFVSSPGTVWRV